MSWETPKPERSKLPSLPVYSPDNGKGYVWWLADNVEERWVEGDEVWRLGRYAHDGSWCKDRVR